jgi:hypothetical protein
MMMMMFNLFIIDWISAAVKVFPSRLRPVLFRYDSNPFYEIHQDIATFPVPRMNATKKIYSDSIRIRPIAQLNGMTIVFPPTLDLEVLLVV